MKTEIDEISIESKKEKSQKLISDNPGKIPVILSKGKNCQLEFPHSLFLVSDSRTLGEFIYSLRKTFKLKKSEGFYLFISDRLPCLSMTLKQLFERLSNEDGFLYMTYTTQEDKGKILKDL